MKDGNPVLIENSDKCVPLASSTIYRTDTIFAGPVILGGSAGLIYHLTRWLAVNVEGRGLAAFPKLGFAFEAQASLQVAFGGGKSNDAPSESEQDNEKGMDDPDGSLSDPPPAE
jgi:hypothetical protein